MSNQLSKVSTLVLNRKQHIGYLGKEVHVFLHFLLSCLRGHDISKSHTHKHTHTYIMKMYGDQSNSKTLSKPTLSFHSHPAPSVTASHQNHSNLYTRSLNHVYSVLLILKIYARSPVLTSIPQKTTAPEPPYSKVSFVTNESGTLRHLYSQPPSTS